MKGLIDGTGSEMVRQQKKSVDELDHMLIQTNLDFEFEKPKF